MSTLCPSCKAGISPIRIRGEFPCPECGVGLRVDNPLSAPALAVVIGSIPMGFARSVPEFLIVVPLSLMLTIGMYGAIVRLKVMRN